jgi:hypothetical protein
LNFLLHFWHVVSFVFCCCLAGLVCSRFGLSFFFLFWILRLYSIVVASFLLGLVYLSLCPSLFSFRTACKHEFSYATFLAWLSLMCAFLVKRCGFGSWSWACVRGGLGSLRIISTMLIHVFYIYVSIGGMLYFSYASVVVIPIIFRNRCCCLAISVFAFLLVDISRGAL